MSSVLTASDLQSKFKGRVVGPTEADYDKLRTVFYGGIDRKPSIIFLAQNATDISQTISLAKENKLELTVRSGGHSVAGYSSVEGGIVIDLREMKGIEVDPVAKTVWAEAGLTARELTDNLDKNDLAVGFGDTGSVGIGGITLGGGIGFLVRKFGMTIDNLLAAEIVTADGTTLTVDNNNHPDLFWAIRGGGGNFGVITKFKFRLHPLTQTIGGILLLPATAEILTKCMELTEAAPVELSGIINVMPAPPMPFLPKEVYGKLVIMALLMYAGDPKEGEKVLAPFRALGQPLADMLKPMRYREIFFPDQESYHPTAVSKNMMMTHVDLEVSQKIIEQLNKSDAPMRAVQLRVLGGAMAKVPENATAYAHRKSKIMTNVAAFYTTPEDKIKKQKWVATTADLLFQGDRGVYIGFLGEDGQDQIKFAYPKETLDRLIEAKRKYDPSNLFHNNLNILPA